MEHAVRRMKNRVILFFILFLSGSAGLNAQVTIGNVSADETVFYAQTKQMNQFFRRFNAEEDQYGKRLYSGDAGYHDPKIRKKYLGILFDQQSPLITADQKFVFIEEVMNKKAPFYLDFHGDNWFAELNATFLYKKEKVNLILYLRLEKQNGGYKWVFSNAYFDRFNRYFSHVGDTTNLRYFIHPMSHELDFMNMHKIFREDQQIDYYLEGDYQPDHLALFIAAVKDGEMKFQSVNNVKFHIFQVPNWYLEVSYFNRNSNNSGWLISNMLRVTEKEKRSLLRNYTHVIP